MDSDSIFIYGTALAILVGATAAGWLWWHGSGDDQGPQDPLL
jgi:hypothetical protein